MDRDCLFLSQWQCNAPPGLFYSNEHFKCGQNHANCWQRSYQHCGSTSSCWSHRVVAAGHSPAGPSRNVLCQGRKENHCCPQKRWNLWHGHRQPWGCLSVGHFDCTRSLRTILKKTGRFKRSRRSWGFCSWLDDPKQGEKARDESRAGLTGSDMCTPGLKTWNFVLQSQASCRLP